MTPSVPRIGSCLLLFLLPINDVSHCSITLTWLCMQMTPAVLQFTIRLKFLKSWQMDSAQWQHKVSKMNFHHRARKKQALGRAYANSSALYVSQNRCATGAHSTFLKRASTLHSSWKMDYSNIVLVESNIELIGNYHIHHTWITNFKRIRPLQNTFNLIFLWWVRGHFKILLCPRVIIMNHYWHWRAWEMVNEAIWSAEHRKTGSLLFFRRLCQGFPFNFDLFLSPGKPRVHSSFHF